ncbi:hypothetical protein [Acinetobacter schindleri]|uniref:hypothetical protein n=1 Tax=Acinetobacter schindleri TaxID=108981 RepID=UPI00161D05F2|nr:hypothetical protein [Acinetobacter schindleri]MBB4835451.1 hypothetical protein [Acinetobacter schindleri]
MATFFALLFLVASIGTIIFLVKPSLTQTKSNPALSRGKILLYGFALNIVLLALVGVFAPEVDNTDSQAAAPAVQNKAQPEVAEKEVQPVKTEASLGMTPEQFRQKFNAQLKALDIETIRPVAEFDIKEGSVRDTFQIMFTQYVGLTGTVNKDGSLRELIFTVGGTEESEKAMMDLLIMSGITAQVISPGTEAGNELVKLITAALKNIGKEENTHKKVIGDVEYYALANEITGLWVGVSPVGE